MQKRMKGDGCIYKRGNTYWMKFYRDGRPVAMSCKTDSPDIAGKKLRVELRKTDAEFIEPKHKRVTVEELYNTWVDDVEARGLSEHARSSRAAWKNHLKAFFGQMKAAQLGTAHQDDYRKQRMAEGAAIATINRELEKIQAAYHLGYEAEPPTVKRVPKFKLLPPNNARRIFATPQQVEALRLAASTYAGTTRTNRANKSSEQPVGLLMRTLLELGIIFGWRRGDLLDLRVRDVRVTENSIRIEDTKNGDAREAPMTSNIRNLILALISDMEPEQKLWPYSTTQFHYHWDGVRKAAGCPELHFHDLRRTSARAKRAAGVDMTVIMEMQGWRTMSMFKRYGIVAIEDKVAALKKLEEYEKAQQLQNAAAQEEQLQNGYIGNQKPVN